MWLSVIIGEDHMLNSQIETALDKGNLKLDLNTVQLLMINADKDPLGTIDVDEVRLSPCTLPSSFLILLSHRLSLSNYGSP